VFGEQVVHGTGDLNLSVIEDYQVITYTFQVGDDV